MTLPCIRKFKLRRFRLLDGIESQADLCHVKGSERGWYFLRGHTSKARSVTQWEPLSAQVHRSFQILQRISIFFWISESFLSSLKATRTWNIAGLRAAPTNGTGVVACDSSVVTSFVTSLVQQSLLMLCLAADAAQTCCFPTSSGTGRDKGGALSFIQAHRHCLPRL